MARERCSSCGGSGKGLPCGRCGGRGTVSCWYCHGKGEKVVRSGVGYEVESCRFCWYGRSDCTWCGGSGNSDCIHCNGSGSSYVSSSPTRSYSSSSASRSAGLPRNFKVLLVVGGIALVLAMVFASVASEYSDTYQSVKQQQSPTYSQPEKKKSADADDFVSPKTHGEQREVRAPGQVLLWTESGLRPRPSDDSPIVRWISEGTMLRWRSKIGPYYEIEHNGIIGYLKENLIAPEYRRATDPMESGSIQGVVVTWRHSGLRTGPAESSRILKWIPEGVVLRVSGERDSYFRVSYEGSVGYIEEKLVDPSYR